MNYLAILLGGVSAMVIGFLWYGAIFGKLWTRLSGFTPEQMAAAQAKGMKKEYGITFIAALLTSTVIEYFLVGFNLSRTGIFVLVGLAWLGFLVPTMLNSVLWEGKSWKLFLLNATERLVTFYVITNILVWWR